MQRARLLLVGLCLSIACQGAHRSSTPVGGPQPTDFSGIWIVQLTIFQDECGFCTSGTPLKLESLTMTQARDSVAASLKGPMLKIDASGSATGSVVSLASGGDLFVNTWYFVNSPATATLSLTNGGLDGVLFVVLGKLGECCSLCCSDGQCFCNDKTCRVPLPDCKMTFQISGYRYPS